MKNFLIHDATGSVLRQVMCEADMIEVQLQAGEQFAEISADAVQAMIDIEQFKQNWTPQ